MNMRRIQQWLWHQIIRLKFPATKPTGWLRDEIETRIRDAKKKAGPVPWRAKIRQIAVPSLKALQAILFLFVISLMASFLLSRWNPRALRIGGISDVRNAFTAMWQIQAGVAAVALPILLFAIELSRDDRQIALRTHEVLIRETWIFPIIAFSIAGTIRIGCDLSWFGKEIVFLTDLLLVICTTLLLTLFAYFRALTLLFNPAKLKARAMRVAREKMQESLDSSIEMRLANNLLFEKLQGLKVGAFIPPPGYPGIKFMVLKASNPGSLSDINMDRLTEFVKELPWKYPHLSFRLTSLDLAINEPTNSPLPGGTRVWFLASYQQILTRQHCDLVCLQRDAFEETFLKEAALEAQLKKIVKIRSSDEG